MLDIGVSPQAAISFAAAAGAAVSRARGCSVAQVTAQQAWRITIDPDIAGDPAAASETWHAEVDISSASGAGTARLPVHTWEGAGTLLVESVDATGALANAAGTIKVVIYRIPNF